MMLIAEICGAVLYVGWIVLLVYGMYKGYVDDETPIWVGCGVFLIATVGITFGILAAAREEKRNPCISWGATETSYVMVNNILTPMTYTPCIRRQNEVAK